MTDHLVAMTLAEAARLLAIARRTPPADPGEVELLARLTLLVADTGATR